MIIDYMNNNYMSPKVRSHNSIKFDIDCWAEKQKQILPTECQKNGET
jgi:hypothetical protein